MKLDLELAESIIIAWIASDLAAKVLEINTEKADGISINDIQYYFSTESEDVNNYNEIIFYGMDSSEVEGIGPVSSNTFEMFILSLDALGLNSSTEQSRKKAFRYSRAFKEIIETNSTSYGGLKIKVSGIVPNVFRLNENSPLYYVGGVIIEGSFA